MCIPWEFFAVIMLLITYCLLLSKVCDAQNFDKIVSSNTIQEECVVSLYIFSV